MLSTLKRARGPPQPAPAPRRKLEAKPSVPVVFHDGLLTALFETAGATPKPTKSIPAQWFDEPDFLQRVAQSFLAEVPDWQPARNSLVLTFATMCSGSEVAVLCCDALGLACAEKGCHLSFKQKFGCESVKEKRAFGMAVAEKVGCDHCFFENIEDLGAETAACGKHRDRCPISRADGAWVKLVRTLAEVETPTHTSPLGFCYGFSQSVSWDGIVLVLVRESFGFPQASSWVRPART